MPEDRIQDWWITREIRTEYYLLSRIQKQTNKQTQKNPNCRDCPGGPGVKNPPSNAGDMGSIPGRGTKTPLAERYRQRKKRKEKNPNCKAIA